MTATASTTLTRRATRREDGFTLLEILVVFMIIITMLFMGIFSYRKAQKATQPDIVGRQISDFLREGNERALMSTLPYRVDITPSTSSTVGTIKLTRTTDNTVVRQETLARYEDIVMARPSGFTAKPTAPFDFSDVTYTSGTFSVIFHADGSAMDTTGTPVPLSMNLYFYAPSPSSSTAAESPNAIRAVSLFGPTGAVRLWSYNGTNFIRK